MGKMPNATDAPDQSNGHTSMFHKLRESLSKTGKKFSLANNIKLGKTNLDPNILEELETQLLSSDVGIETADQILEKLISRRRKYGIGSIEELRLALREDLIEILHPSQLSIDINRASPFVMLMVGANGSGKTTTIGKLAKYFLARDMKIMLAAGDTYRAAASEQLRVLGERISVPVVSQDQGADSASVIYDAFVSARARGIDILIADTAGRLHGQHHLMEELRKIIRVIRKLDEEAPHEIMLVLDAGTGQNGLSQAVEFKKEVAISGLTLTKLDGTAKGGIIFALAKRLGLPIRYIGIGESSDDIRPFVAAEFVEALLETEKP